MRDFLSAIPAAGASPLAFAAYAILVLAWTFITMNVRRTDRLFNAIKELPEDERLKAIALEYRTTPAKGLTAAQWLKVHKSRQLFFGFVATLVCLIVLVALVLQHRSTQIKQAMEGYIRISDHRGVFIVRDLDEAAARIPELATKIAELREKVAPLLKERIEALKKGDLILAQDLANRINSLYYRSDLHIPPPTVGVHTKRTPANLDTDKQR